MYNTIIKPDGTVQFLSDDAFFNWCHARHDDDIWNIIQEGMTHEESKIDLVKRYGVVLPHDYTADDAWEILGYIYGKLIAQPPERILRQIVYKALGHVPEQQQEA